MASGLGWHRRLPTSGWMAADSSRGRGLSHPLDARAQQEIDFDEHGPGDENLSAQTGEQRERELMGERVTFRWKDYRAPEQNRDKTIALDTVEFIRRFVIHTLPRGLHRIRHDGLFANARRASTLRGARTMLEVAVPFEPDEKRG